jgi:hypothetical protein
MTDAIDTGVDTADRLPGAFLVALTRTERQAMKRLGWTAVFVEGLDGRKPRDFGDNCGAWACRVGTTAADPRTRTRDADYDNPLHGIVLHRIWWLRSSDEATTVANRARALLRDRGEVLRHGWHDIEPTKLAELVIWAATVEGVDWHTDDECHRAVVADVIREAENQVRARFRR